jgi:hypothetical protein
MAARNLDLPEGAVFHSAAAITHRRSSLGY